MIVLMLPEIQRHQLQIVNIFDGIVSIQLRFVAYSFVYSIDLILQMNEMKAPPLLPFEIKFADCMN